MILRRVYRFKMEPNQEQTHKLYQLAGARRFVYNWALARRKEHFETTGETLRYAAQNLELTQLKKEEERLWLKEADSQALQESLRDVEHAFCNFFGKRARFPKFKSKKKGHFAFRIPQRVKVESGKIYCPKIGWMKIRQSQEIEGETKSATFKRAACGDWFVSLTVEFEREVQPVTKSERPVGVDFGLKDFVTLSNEEAVVAPQFFRRLVKKLAKAQRKLSRAQRGSARRQKAKLKVAKAHRKIASRRADFVHKVSSGLVKRFDHIGIEDLNVEALAKTKLRGHAKSWQNAACGEFVRQLEYKCQWNSVRLVKVNRFFPSSKLCGACGTVNKSLTLSERVWTCECGKVHHRDRNAAQNILRESLNLAAGHAERLNAHGEGVRPVLPATFAEVRIPGF